MERKLPVGIDSFEKIRKENFYYVDKSFLIRDLLNNWREVNLFTRPRRFGKTLNMSMLKSFFELGTDTTLFDGLAIAKETEICKRYMGKFPVVFISLKSVDGLSFANARDMLWEVIQKEIRHLQYLIQDNQLSKLEEESFMSLMKAEASDTVIQKSLLVLTELLYKYHGQLLGLLRSRADWLLRSNAESGDGFSDILIEPEDPDAGIVIEVKYAASISGLDKACDEAMKQIKDRRYDERLRNDGRSEIKAYGIAFCKKRCKVMGEIF